MDIGRRGVAMEIIKPCGHIQSNLYSLCPIQNLMIVILVIDPVAQRSIASIFINKVPVPIIETNTREADKIEMIDSVQ